MAEEGQQAREEPEPLRPEEQAGREFMAGWFDGVYSGRTSTLHHLRQDLERLALTMDEAGEIHPLTPGAPRTKLTTPHIDNPLHDPNYERGWERGFEQVTQLLLKRAAANLPRHGLSLVSKHGRPLSLEEGEEDLADLYTVRVAANRPTRLGDQSLHASLDHALQEASVSPEACSLEAASLTEHFKSSLLLKTKGVLTMSHKHIDRRAVIISLGTVLACGAFSYAFWPKTDTTPLPKSRTTPGYVVPGWLSQVEPHSRAFLMAWDRIFWQIESQQPAPILGQTSLGNPFNNVAALVLASMTMPGNDRFKSSMAAYLSLSNRAAYIPYLIPGLNPSNTGTKARQAIAGSLSTLQHKSGSAAFNTASRQALLGFYQNETDAVAHRHLDTLLAALGVAH